MGIVMISQYKTDIVFLFGPFFLSRLVSKMGLVRASGVVSDRPLLYTMHEPRFFDRGPLNCRACVADMGQTHSGRRMSPIRRSRGAFDFDSLLGCRHVTRRRHPRQRQLATLAAMVSALQ